MTLGNVTTANGKIAYNQLCDGGTLDSSQFAVLGKPDTSGLYRVRVLFQNSLRSCIPSLDQVTSFHFQSNEGPVSFCMDDISLLPSTLQPAGELAVLPTSVLILVVRMHRLQRYLPTQKPQWCRNYDALPICQSLRGSKMSCTLVQLLVV